MFPSPTALPTAAIIKPKLVEKPPRLLGVSWFIVFFPALGSRIDLRDTSIHTQAQWPAKCYRTLGGGFASVSEIDVGAGDARPSLRPGRQTGQVEAPAAPRHRGHGL